MLQDILRGGGQDATRHAKRGRGQDATRHAKKEGGKDAARHITRGGGRVRSTQKDWKREGGGLQIVGILMDATINSWRGNPLKVEIIFCKEISWHQPFYGATTYVTSLKPHQ